jgi:TPR repeat protein
MAQTVNSNPIAAGVFPFNGCDSPVEVLPKLLHGRSFESLDLMAASTISFPESLENFRENAKKSNDPETQLSFVRYLMESSNKIQEDPGQLGIVLPTSPTGGECREIDERKLTMRKLLEAEALRWLKRLATTAVGIGRPPLADAQFMLAEFYGKGMLALAVDHGKAFGLYVQASKQNHPTATYRAAVCYEVGAGTKKDNKRAVQFYRKAAALGDSLAMHKVALILLYGKLNSQKNLKEGITWLKRAANAADALHPESLHDLAQCYERRGGCPVLIPDEHYAFELYARAAQFGFAPSQYRLGTCYEYGLLGCQVEPSNSVKWYGKAAEQGFPDAELALSSWYLSGSHGVLAQSDTDAYLWARKAADRGHSKAEYQVGSFFEAGIGVEVDGVEALRWYQKAAAQGHKRAIQRLVDIKKAGKKTSRCIVS